MQTLDGELAVRWERDGGAVILAVTVPWSGKADVTVPIEDSETVAITESGHDLIVDGTTPNTLPDGVTSVSIEDKAGISTEAETYRFAIDAG